ncbi:MAG: DUF3592 domain-containing protein [Ectothiorhodospiraceae bacterium]|nr:DUF3592 domain-containing protein [Ectothiorhodospiraceae bacterium]
MNLYSLILAFTTLAGIGLSLWGWGIIQKSKAVREWPQTSGIIEVSDPTSEANDLLPDIVFSYQVNNKDYRKHFEFPEGTHPLPEFAKAYNEKYPVGATVLVFHNPEKPEIATLEPGAQGDWMILAMGIALTIVGALSLLLS